MSSEKSSNLSFQYRLVIRLYSAFFYHCFSVSCAAQFIYLINLLQLQFINFIIGLNSDIYFMAGATATQIIV